MKNYGPGAGKKPIVSGHPEIELALIELYRTTGDKHDVAVVVGREPGNEFRAEMQKDLLGGIMVLKHTGAVYETPLSQQPLYQLFAKGAQRASRPVSLTMIPYYAWSNREPTAMEVWIPYIHK